MTFDYAFTPSRGPDRSQAARWAHETVAAIERGSYVAPCGRAIDLAAGVARMLEGTRDLPPDAPVAPPTCGPRTTRVSVLNGTSLAAARAMAKAGGDDEPLVLNFASAKNPGGGFLGGARAQEESLAWSSTLYASLRTSAMYDFHRAQKDPLYTDWMIYSPHVTVFREDAGALLDEPYDCAFLTSPAPNAGVVLERDPGRLAEVEAAMDRRIDRALAIAAEHGHRRLVLGAWGCGVFRNDPRYVAGSFARALGGSAKGVFDEIVFAVLDWSPERRFVRPFAERFSIDE